MAIPPVNMCNSFSWFSKDNVRITIHAKRFNDWLHIVPDYVLEQEALRFYCEVVRDPNFHYDPKRYLQAWVEEVEALDYRQIPPHELEVLRRLRKIFEV